MLENQIRGLAVVFGIRLPRALTAGFVKQALEASEGVIGLAAAMRGLVEARSTVLSAITAIDREMKRLARASEACRRLMTIPGVGPITALAFCAAVDVPERFKRSREIGAYLVSFLVATSPARSTTAAAYPSAATVGSGRCSTRLRT
jgi:transposase